MIGWIIAGSRGRADRAVAGQRLQRAHHAAEPRPGQAGGRSMSVLKRRHDLIGNLVETVKGYAHERGTPEDVMKARAAAMAGGQSPRPAGPERGTAQRRARPPHRRRRGLPGPQGQPELPRPVQEPGPRPRTASLRLVATTTPVSASLNTRVESVPSNVVAGMFSIRREEYFEAEGAERDAVRVDSASARPPSRRRAGMRGHGSSPAAPPAHPSTPSQGFSPLGDSRPRPASRPPS